jgi:hypothetical protein
MTSSVIPSPPPNNPASLSSGEQRDAKRFRRNDQGLVYRRSSRKVFRHPGTPVLVLARTFEPATSRKTDFCGQGLDRGPQLLAAPSQGTPPPGTKVSANRSSRLRSLPTPVPACDRRVSAATRPRPERRSPVARRRRLGAGPVVRGRMPPRTPGVAPRGITLPFIQRWHHQWRGRTSFKPRQELHARLAG